MNLLEFRKLKWTQKEDDIEIELPGFDPNLPPENGYAYVLKIRK